MPFELTWSEIVDVENERDVPFEDTGFYKWLAKGNYTGYRIKDVPAYLVSLGFKVGTDKIGELELSTLRVVFDAYFDREVKPALGRLGRFLG